MLDLSRDVDSQTRPLGARFVVGSTGDKVHHLRAPLDGEVDTSESHIADPGGGTHNGVLLAAGSPRQLPEQLPPALDQKFVPIEGRGKVRFGAGQIGPFEVLEETDSFIAPDVGRVPYCVIEIKVEMFCKFGILKGEDDGQ